MDVAAIAELDSAMQWGGTEEKGEGTLIRLRRDWLGILSRTGNGKP